MAGRTTAARSQPTVQTNTNTAVTGPAGTFVVGADVGAPITGTGIPAGTTLAAVASSTAATLSQAATATAAVTVVIGPEKESAAGYVGLVAETGLQQNAWTVAGVTAGSSPDVLADNVTRISQPVSP